MFLTLKMFVSASLFGRRSWIFCFLACIFMFFQHEICEGRSFRFDSGNKNDSASSEESFVDDGDNDIPSGGHGADASTSSVSETERPPSQQQMKMNNMKQQTIKSTPAHQLQREPTADEYRVIFAMMHLLPSAKDVGGLHLPFKTQAEEPSSLSSLSNNSNSKPQEGAENEIACGICLDKTLFVVHRERGSDKSATDKKEHGICARSFRESSEQARSSVESGSRRGRGTERGVEGGSIFSFQNEDRDDDSTSQHASSSAHGHGTAGGPSVPDRGGHAGPQQGADGNLESAGPGIFFERLRTCIFGEPFLTTGTRSPLAVERTPEGSAHRIPDSSGVVVDEAISSPSRNNEKRRKSSGVAILPCGHAVCTACKGRLVAETEAPTNTTSSPGRPRRTSSDIDHICGQCPTCRGKLRLRRHEQVNLPRRSLNLLSEDSEAIARRDHRTASTSGSEAPLLERRYSREVYHEQPRSSSSFRDNERLLRVEEPTTRRTGETSSSVEAFVRVPSRRSKCGILELRQPLSVRILDRMLTSLFRVGNTSSSRTADDETSETPNVQNKAPPSLLATHPPEIRRDTSGVVDHGRPPSSPLTDQRRQELWVHLVAHAQKAKQKWQSFARGRDTHSKGDESEFFRYLELRDFVARVGLEKASHFVFDRVWKAIRSTVLRGLHHDREVIDDIYHYLATRTFRGTNIPIADIPMLSDAMFAAPGGLAEVLEMHEDCCCGRLDGTRSSIWHTLCPFACCLWRGAYLNDLPTSSDDDVHDFHDVDADREGTIGGRRRSTHFIFSSSDEDEDLDQGSSSSLDEINVAGTRSYEEEEDERGVSGSDFSSTSAEEDAAARIGIGEEILRTARRSRSAAPTGARTSIISRRRRRRRARRTASLDIFSSCCPFFCCRRRRAALVEHAVARCPCLNPALVCEQGLDAMFTIAGLELTTATCCMGPAVRSRVLPVCFALSSDLAFLLSALTCTTCSVANAALALHVVPVQSYCASTGCLPLVHCWSQHFFTGPNAIDCTCNSACCCLLLAGCRTGVGGTAEQIVVRRQGRRTARQEEPQEDDGRRASERETRTWAESFRACCCQPYGLLEDMSRPHTIREQVQDHRISDDNFDMSETGGQHARGHLLEPYYVNRLSVATTSTSASSNSATSSSPLQLHLQDRYGCCARAGHCVENIVSDPHCCNQLSVISRHASRTRARFCSPDTWWVRAAQINLNHHPDDVHNDTRSPCCCLRVPGALCGSPQFLRLLQTRAMPESSEISERVTSSYVRNGRSEVDSLFYEEQFIKALKTTKENRNSNSAEPQGWQEAVVQVFARRGMAGVPLSTSTPRRSSSVSVDRSTARIQRHVAKPLWNLMKDFRIMLLLNEDGGSE